MQFSMSAQNRMPPDRAPTGREHICTVATVEGFHNSLAAAKPSQFLFYELNFQKIMNKIWRMFGKQWKMDTKDANEIRLCAAGTSECA